MDIKVKVKQTGEETTLSVEEYPSGLYVIENNDPARQYGLPCTLDEFLDSLENDKSIEIIRQDITGG